VLCGEIIHNAGPCLKLRDTVYNYSKLNESSPYPPTLFKMDFKKYPPIYTYALQVVSFFLIVWPKQVHMYLLSHAWHTYCQFTLCDSVDLIINNHVWKWRYHLHTHSIIKPININHPIINWQSCDTYPHDKPRREWIGYKPVPLTKDNHKIKTRVWPTCDTVIFKP
jgi:hypothetical protein